jgi:hypothetical protein
MGTEVNYLILFDKKIFQFSGVERFSALIGLAEGIKVDSEKSEITFNSSIFSYSLTSEGDRFENHETELFDLQIESKKNEQDVENLFQLLREIRIIVSNQKGTITPVFDGVSAYYAEKAYPIIHHIENLMRKLYTKFTLVQLGPKWVDSIPNEVGSSSKVLPNGHNPLYDFDFITISELLFKDYPTKQIDSVVLTNIKKGAISPEDIEAYIPTSNWERYFSEMVDCESKYLENRWKKLYSLRNKIAHNKLFSKSDLNDVKKISEEVKLKLNQALETISSASIETVSLPTPKDAEVLEGELCQDSIPTVETEDSDNNLGGLVTLALVGAFLGAIARA